MNPVLQHCIDIKSSRFIVQDDGLVFIEAYVDGPLVPFDIDASIFLKIASGIEPYTRKVVDDLIPDDQRNNWRLLVQREDNFSIWSIYSRSPSKRDRDT